MTAPSQVNTTTIAQTKSELATRFQVAESDIHVTPVERRRKVGDGIHATDEGYYYELSFEVRIPLAGLLRERAEAAEAARVAAEKAAADKAAAEAAAVAED